MFGYIRPLREELKVRDLDRYQAAYCGLCRTLGRRYGFCARFLVSYDMTFLFWLLHSPLPADGVSKCRCPARLLEKKPCMELSAPLEQAADFSLILYWWKLRDNLADEPFFRRTGTRMAMACLRRAYRRAAGRHPETDAAVRDKLEALRRLERDKTDNMDAAADCFAQILRQLSTLLPPCAQRAGEQILYHVGRFIYLVDALDDLGKDCRNDHYNVLRYRFTVTDGALEQSDLEYLQTSINCSISMAGAAFELLDAVSGREILENIIYFGMPAVLRSVAAGSFQNKRKI